MRIAMGTALLCCACADVPIQPLAEIPIQVRHGIPTAEVSISGRPLMLMLDLGGNQGISLTTSELGQVNVSFLPSTTKFKNSNGEEFESRRFIAPSVSIGGFFVGNIEGGESHFGSSIPPDRNGYIGMPVLGRYLLVLDYPSGKVRLYRSGDAQALQTECGSHTFPITLTDGIAHSTVKTKYGDLEFVWDTGTTHNFLRPSAIRAAPSAGSRIDDGPPVITLRKVSLAGYELGPQDFRLVQFAAPAVDGYLGAGLFSSRRVCLDIAQQTGAIL